MKCRITLTSEEILIIIKKFIDQQLQASMAKDDKVDVRLSVDPPGLEFNLVVDLEGTLPEFLRIPGPDMRGSGRSVPGRVSPLTPDEIAASIGKVLDVRGELRTPGGDASG